MEISVKLFAEFSRYHTPPQFRMGLAGETPVGEILKALGIPEGLPKIVLVDGLVAGEARLMQDGETLTLFSPVDGG